MKIVKAVKRGDATIEIAIDTDRLDKMMVEAQGLGKLAAVVQKCAFDVEGRAKKFYPVDTGRLANSIQAEQVKVEPGIVYADIAPHTEYAIYVEMGHRTKAGTYVMGHHYMTRALYIEAEKLQRALRTWAEQLGGEATGGIA